MTSLRGRAGWRAAAVAGAIAAGALTLAPPVSTQAPGRVRVTTVHEGREVVSGEVLVKYRQANAVATRASIEQAADTDESVPVGGAALGIRRVHSRRMSTAALLASLRANPAVEFAEPNYIVGIGRAPQDPVQTLVLIPNDPSFGNVWGLRNTGQTILGVAGTAGADIGAAAAWSTTTGSRANVVAVIDTGIDYNHPDLAANIWSAPAPFSVTIGGVTINCAAGTHGFNAITRTCDPMDDNNHGTHVAGTIGAVGNNNVGVAGVNWTASIIGGKFLASNGFGATSDALDAIEFMIQAKAAFAGSNGANVRVLSNSWGGGGFSQLFLNEINSANAAGMLFVAAAGNNASNNDSVANYPSNYNAPNVVAVAATDNRDQLASFSNWGATTVHLAAPGVSVLSTLPNNSYGYFNGTSMATPHVSGAAALILSACSLSTANLKSALLQSTDAFTLPVGKAIAGGRLNVNAALQACANPPSAPTLVSPTGAIATQTPTYTWNAVSGATRYQLYVQVTGGAVMHQRWYDASAVCSGSTCAVTPAVTLSVGTAHTFYVQAYNLAGYSAWSSGMAFTTPGGVPGAATMTSPSGSIATLTPAYQWAAVANATRYQLYVQVTGGAVVHQRWYDASAICSGSACSVTPAVTLAAGVNHTAYVQTSGSGGNGPWSAGIAFVTPGGVPGAATMTSPSGSIATLTPSYQWNAVANATRYQLYVQVTSGGVVHQRWYDASAICSGSTCSVTPAVTLAAGTNHTAYVQTYGTGGYGPWSAGLAFTTPGGAPGATTLIAPSGTVATSTPTYQWNVVSGATRYQLYVQVTSGGVVHQRWYDASDVCSGSTCAVTPAVTLATGTSHTFYVQTYSSAGYGPWSGGLSFTPSASAPGTPTLISPSGTITTTSPTFVWNIVNGASAYQLYVEVAGGAVVHQRWYAASAACGSSTCAIAPGLSLVNGANYRFYVQAYNSSGYGAWSSAMAFTVSAVSVS